MKIKYTSQYKYRRTKKGVIAKMYGSQRGSSKSRGQALPNYSLDEFRDKLMATTLFHTLFNNWEINNYNTLLVPSADRKDDSLPYTLNNIQLMTWEENSNKYHAQVKAGIAKHKGINLAVQQFSLDGELINTFHSASEARRQTGIADTNIRSCCKHKLNCNTAGGFRWEYA